jgi:hypothetical protein
MNAGLDADDAHQSLFDAPAGERGGIVGGGKWTAFNLAIHHASERGQVCVRPSVRGNRRWDGGYRDRVKETPGVLYFTLATFALLQMHKVERWLEEGLARLVVRKGVLPT